MTCYILIDRKETHGFTDNRVLWTLTWISLDDLEIYHGAIDPTFKNYTRCGWERIIEHPSPWGVYENLFRKKTASGIVIDADSAPHWTEELTLDEIAQYVKIRLDTAKKSKPKQKFARGLFSIED
jgi:hypothetical protein